MSRKKVGLAFSGGAARGFAHLGVLKVLVENKIPIDCVAGTSAGSIAGSAFAAGLSVKDIVELGKKMSWYKMTGLSYSTKGLLSNASMGNFFRENYPFNKFEDLPIPFAAVATDLESGEEVILSEKGDLITAVQASCAIPGIFKPIVHDDKQLIDGGVVAAVPTNAVRKLGAEIVIAVDVISCGATYWGTPTTLVGIVFQSMMMLLRAASKSHHVQADVVIVPNIAHLRPDEIGKMDEFIKLGEEAALAKIDEIKALIEANQNSKQSRPD